MEGELNPGYSPDEEVENKAIPNVTTNEKIDIVSLDDEDSFVLDRGKTNLINDQPTDKCDEKEPEAKPKEETVPPVGFCTLFRFSSCCDKFLIIFATLVALGSGASIPAVMTIFGKVIDQLVDFDIANKNQTEPHNVTTTEFLKATANLCMWNAIFGVAFFVCNYIYVSFFSLAAANQAFKIRCRFMQAVLKQDMAWYDTHKTGDFATRITGDLSRIQEGLGEKVGICISFMSSSVLCAGCGLYYGWKLALVIFCVTPVLTAAMAIMSKIQASVSSEELEAYGTAGAVAEEVLSSIRTVVAFGGQKKETERYESCLISGSKKGIKRGLLTSIGAAVTQFCIFAGYALAFWYGVKLIVEGQGQENPEYTGGKLIIVFFNVMFASMFIGQTVPYFEAFALARGAAAKIYSIIDREPTIDSSSEVGLKPFHLEGHIQLKDVHFNYPSRPTVPLDSLPWLSNFRAPTVQVIEVSNFYVTELSNIRRWDIILNLSLDSVTNTSVQLREILCGLNLEVKPGETVALVGSSGCGKSTIVQLILRFYDTLSGSVELDGIDVKDLNLGWLRDQIGLVGQEPVLFSTTIEENIRMGRNDATQEEIVQAAKIANAHNFIEALPMKYNTAVGERGTQLSGGQKQRIAIARALVRNPRILLLDEATSALDTESEAVVQAALDEARRGRTTIIVAHRLSTIRTADKIVVLDNGVVKETGTHDELMEVKGLYYNLVVAQTKDEEKEDEDLPELERRTSIQSSGSEDGQNQPPTDKQISTLRRELSVTGVKEKEEEEVDASSFSRMRLLKITAPEWPYVVVGGISAILMGFHFPAFGIIFGSILGVLSGPAEDMEEKNAFYCLLFLLLAITSGVFGFLQTFLFSVAGEKLTFRLRKLVFANIITQDITFFDNSKNSVGSLCSRLNSDASSVQGATGSQIATALQSLSTMGLSIFIGLFYNWKIGLVVMSFVPLVVLAATLEAKVVRGHMHSERKGVEEASKLAIEAIESIRTVASLNQEERFYHHYRNALLGPHKKSRFKSHIRGVAYGFGQGVTAFAYATTMYYGSILVSRREVKYSDLLIILQGVLVGAMKIGQAVAFTPDYEKARVAAAHIFKLLELRPVIDAFSFHGITKPSIEGTVDFSNVSFSYPTRPQVKVLRGLEASVQPGQTVALVGSSGCGKSTCVQLLERFYDPTKGKVLVDSDDIRDLNVSNHRSHLALVSQEPVLFGRTIAENIAYGDNLRQPDMAEIIAVSRQANIHGFISTLPQGYDTPVGDRGTQLSGGQKQRIAIARALIRNPRILLLDEATSALDTESEKVVQEALDLARTGRTCLVIAHRLSTVQNADLILVLNKGRIVEKGTHQELINKKGIYYGLHNTQVQNVK